VAKSKAKKETPLMKQYNGIKSKYPDAMLLFRVGDFYETFGKDAIKCAQILNITLTKRGSGSDSETALAGFPHHSLNTYLPKLVKYGLRVAICDQLEDPKKTKTIVKRGVTELVTPGVALNDEVLQSKSNNFLAAVHIGKKTFGVSFLDISTGEFLTAEGDSSYINKLLQNFLPSEILVEKKHKLKFDELFGESFHTFYLEDWVFQIEFATERLQNHFKVNSFKGFGVDSLHEGIIASGSILHYLYETQHKKLSHITNVQRIYEQDYVWMDRFTIRNLELYHSTNENAVTLLHIIDQTNSPMGARLLKRWLALPLKEVNQIVKRQEVVDYFINEQVVFNTATYQIKQISDIERLISKVATQKINPREIVYLKQSLDAIIPIKQAAEQSNNITLKAIGEQLQDFTLLRQKIGDTLVQDARLLKREAERTGIPSLKIAFNNVFGYYIEVRNTHKSKVPENWIRKQTLVNAERYITEELKEYESKILGAEEKIAQLEQQLFLELVCFLHDFIQPIQHNANLIAQLDCLCGFATLAINNNYVRPTLDQSTDIEIKNGRHPVIEKQLSFGQEYVANDLVLNRNQQQIIMITGPNMSGKSAILRQTALIVLLAQIGCYVPAEQARIGVVDKIFTRVGASDNISMGESTFMVEMNETASILNNVSDRSLILLDEIGRGTSTYDGISIAWAIAEYLHEHTTQAKTLFATHYHELNEMTSSFKRIKNFNVAVKELKDKVIFLRKLTPGGSEHSFGIHVAKLAGMPKAVVLKAQKMLGALEKNQGLENNKAKLDKEVKNEDYQMSFFQLDDPLLENIKDEILATDINSLTPVEALMKLNEIKNLLTTK